MADFSTESETFNGFAAADFVDYTQNPETAIMLYHTNSGHGRFLKSMDLFDVDGTLKADHLLQVQKEVKEQMLTPDQTDELLQKFAVQQGKKKPMVNTENDQNLQHCLDPSLLEALPQSTDAHILGCGACGKKTVHGMCGQLCRTTFLDKLPTFMKMKNAEAEKFVQSRPAQLVPIPISNDSNSFKTVDLSLLRSVHHSTPLESYFLLHPELVHTNEKGR